MCIDDEFIIPQYPMFLSGTRIQEKSQLRMQNNLLYTFFFFFNSTYSFIPAFIFSVTIETTVYSYKLIETSILMEKTHDRL